MSETQNISNAEFLQAVFGETEEGEAIATCGFSGSVEDRKYWTVYPPEHEAVKHQLADTASNNYFCISSVEDGPVLRRRNHSLKRTFVIPLDDVGTGLGAKVTPAEVPLSPTYIIETSPQNFQYGYVLDVPEADLAAAKTLIKLMAQMTGSDDGGSMAAKLIRLPVGYNHKDKYGVLPPPTKLTLWNPERRFSFDELVEGFSVDVETFNRIYDDETATILAKDVLPGTQDDVLTWLAQGNALHSDVPDASGFLPITCPWNHLHTDGSLTAGYSPLGLGGEYSHSRQFNCLHGHCQHRTAKDLIDVMFRMRFSYVDRDSKIRDTMYPQHSHSVTDFHNKMKPFNYWVEEPRRKQCFHSQDWLQRTDRVNVEDETFVPDASKVGPHRDMVTGQRLFNSFVPYQERRPYTASEDKIGPILEHLKYLFGSEYENALGFLAYTFHRPTVRLGFALLHVAQHHGTGRGWLKELFAKLFVFGYHKPASFQNYVTTSYNEFLYRSLLVSFDEVYDRKERFTVGEKLRELITESSMEVNVKYGYKGEIPIFANFIFLSNHIDALMIPDDDRRFWCVICEHEPQSADYYTQLYNLLEDEDAMAQFFWYLKRVLATTAFNPKGRAPVTEWTEEIKNSTRDEGLETPLRETIKRYRLLGVKAVWKSQLISDARAGGADISIDLGARSGQSRQIEAILRENRLRRHSTRVRREGGKLEYAYFVGSETSREASVVREWADAAAQFALPTSNVSVFPGSLTHGSE